MVDFDIERYIPHRGRMKLLNEIISVDDTAAVTASIPTDQWPLSGSDGVNPLVLIELVAQTSAVSIRWRELQKNPDTPDGRGWLVGIKSATFRMESIPLNTRVTTRSTVNFSIDDYTEIHGITRMGDTVVGEVTLQVMRDNGEEKNDGTE